MTTKNVKDLDIGDQRQIVKTICNVSRSATTVTVTYDDSTSDTWNGVDVENPSIEVL